MTTLKVNWQQLKSVIDSLMYRIKTIMFVKILVMIKKCLVLVTILLGQNIVMIQTKE